MHGLCRHDHGLHFDHAWRTCWLVVDRSVGRVLLRRRCPHLLLLAVVHLLNRVRVRMWWVDGVVLRRKVVGSVTRSHHAAALGLAADEERSR